MPGEPEPATNPGAPTVTPPSEATVAGQGKRARGWARGIFKQVEDELFERILGEIEDDFEAWEPADITDADLAL